MSLRPLVQVLSLAAALCSFGLTAFAQETTTEEKPATEELSMGTTASAPAEVRTKETAAVGEGYLSGTFEQWELRCIKTEDGKDPCELFQLLKDAEGNPVAEFSLFGLPAGGKAAAGGSVVAPLGTLLTENLAIGVDTAEAKLYPFSFCLANGCVSRVGFTAEEIEQFKKGNKAIVTLVPAVPDAKPVNLDVSLAGFTAGYEAVVASVPAE